MILQALCDYYQMLANDPEAKIARPGYSQVPCSYAILLNTAGDLLSLITLAEGKHKEVLTVPEQKGRSGKKAYFLCDNAKYLLGGEFNKKEKTLAPAPDYLSASYAYHGKRIGSTPDPGLQAVLSFLKKRMNGESVDIPADHPVYLGGNIVFRLENDSGYIHEREAATDLCAEQELTDAETPRSQCLITGEENVPIARIHKLLSGVTNANTTGCAVVSFNMDSVESYGKKQSYNAPVSESAMFQYTTALNYLLAGKTNKLRLGETTVVFWANKKGIVQNSMAFFLNNAPDTTESGEDTEMEAKIARLLIRVREGKSISDIADPTTQTYILGLSPNAARASIRFWYEDTFGNFITKMADHQNNMWVGSPHKPQSIISISQILRKLAPESKTWWENVPASYENALFKAIVTGGRYPMSVYTAVLVRIRAEAGKEYSIDAVRAGYLKAVLRRNYYHEELSMSLDLSSTNPAYLLGNLFAVLELLQKSANGSSNIRSRYFASASVNPKLVFPSLLNLAQHHIVKDDQSGGWYDRQIQNLLGRITEFPAYLSLEDQGMFVLGYYHQREYNYLKKEDKEKLEA
ncbi:type I-C CRISPR-associated protein Cas8c/Csd1 [Methanocorpusculum sp. MG]|uniref:Type I-C CRISPR-associated protein Cas8c/Csd1 n=1 Tax=Methanocorpusculum petauri TaxID=3002863 RepID=A0ABT4IEC9_9EURY|nr:type I-C CRISPR-associated protein Cas8c/Csd1 [Methanocorpusculum petauri]MCZ0860099.1 type I-C CRISPR-associated protein Cas8c/Csd1 [Methanocorpusculum petauri]